MIRVFLVDDDPTFREGLVELLGLTGDIEVVGQAGDVEEAWRAGQKVCPDVIVLDAELPLSGCIEGMVRLARTEARDDARPSFVCLAVYPDQHDAAVQAGAMRFLRKDGPPRELIEAIRAAARRS